LFAFKRDQTRLFQFRNHCNCSNLKLVNEPLFNSITCLFSFFGGISLKLATLLAHTLHFIIEIQPPLSVSHTSVPKEKTMSSASAMNPVASLQQGADDNNAAAATTAAPYPNDDANEWPALSPAAAASALVDNDDWELLPGDDSQEQVAATRSPTVVRIVEPDTKKLPANLKQLQHCQSSPDLRHLVLEDSESSSSSGSSQSGDDTSAVLIDNADVTSVASSSVVVVPNNSQPAVKSAWGGGVSFKDTLLKNGAEDNLKAQHHHHHHKHHHKRRAKKQPTFVVKPIARSAKSTGDLQVLAHIAENDGEVLGDTDAQLFYHQKALGKIATVNARKKRPDELKRLEMMNQKKEDQRLRQKFLAGRR
jgi:hypothetical protein